MGALRRGLLAATTVVVALAGAACSGDAGRGGARADGEQSETVAQPVLVTQGWGVVDGMLSVKVQNTTDRTLSTAEAVVTARGRDDAPVSSSLEGAGDGCCAVTDLPPGGELGFYVDVGDDAVDISSVEVAYRDVRWAPEGESPVDTVTARPVRIDADADGAVVVADVEVSDPLVTRASVQAFLDGPDGRFLAVVSGRWYCFSKGGHQIRMQLLHPVPSGTTIDQVVIRPVADAPDGTDSTDSTDSTGLTCARPSAKD